MAKARTVFVLACFALLVLLAILSVFKAQDIPRVTHGQGNTNIPSRTAGHHASEVATISIAGNNDYSKLQDGGDNSRDDYLIVCDQSSNGSQAKGGIWDSANGWYYVFDGYGNGCSAREYFWNGEGHNINGGHYSSHN